MNPPLVLVAGIGNIFLGDDAFGVEVVRRMGRRATPAGVRVLDFGIRGMDLAYALLDSYARAILVDAVPRGGPPGTVYVLQPDLESLGDTVPGWPVVEAHRMDPVSVLRLAQALGGPRPEVVIVGCEPATLLPVEDGQASLSPPVEAAVEEAISLVESLAKDAVGR